MDKQNIQKKELYLSVQDLLTHEEFNQKIQEEIKKAEGLIDEDTAALLIVDKMGRYHQPVKKIKDLTPSRTPLFLHTSPKKLMTKNLTPTKQ